MSSSLQRKKIAAAVCQSPSEPCLTAFPNQSLGVSMIGGGAVSLVAVAAVFFSNLSEGLSSAAGMKKANRSASYVFGV